VTIRLGLARSNHFPELIQHLYPDGQITSVYRKIESSPSRKNISVLQKCKSSYMNSHPVPLRGALRNVPARGGDAVDVDGAADEGA
jgi:hypothetical protein